MPELPEVETTVRGINEKVKGRTIRGLWCERDKLISPHNPKGLLKLVKGRKIVGARRRGKNILIDLEGNIVIRVHMKMTGHLMHGRWQYYKKNSEWQVRDDGPLKDPYNRFLRFALIFEDDTMLSLSDMRRFAVVSTHKREKESEEKWQKDMGPEPLSAETTFPVFKSLFANKTTRPIKVFLLDQTVIAGIGNIYSDEILFRAGIDPRRLPSSLTSPEISLAYKHMRETLEKGISLGGDSMSDYRNIEGKKGKFQETHRAYRRTGKPCGKHGCRGKISRIKLGGRSTHFCPLHQK